MALLVCTHAVVAKQLPHRVAVGLPHRRRRIRVGRVEPADTVPARAGVRATSVIVGRDARFR